MDKKYIGEQKPSAKIDLSNFSYACHSLFRLCPSACFFRFRILLKILQRKMDTQKFRKSLLRPALLWRQSLFCFCLCRLPWIYPSPFFEYPAENKGMKIPPKGKHMFGSVKVGDKGQIVIPARARKIFDIQPGDNLIVLGDEGQGIAIIKEKGLMDLLNMAREAEEI